MKIGKYIPITATAITTTSGLFFLMQSLVADNEIQVDQREPVRIIDFVQAIEEPEVSLTDRTIEPPVEITPPPPRVTPVPTNTEGNPSTNIPTGPPPLPGPPEGPQIGGYTDGAQIPLVRIQASYPRKALERGIAGWAVVAFRIDPSGTVQDPEIIEAEPVGYFERATLKTIKKFRYKPKVINGQAVESFGQFRMVFNLDE